MHSAERIRKQEFSDTLPQASIQDLGVILMGAGYEVRFLFAGFMLLRSFLAECADPSLIIYPKL